MIVFPNTKINIGLNIVARRPDGYHNLESVFFPIPIQDALEVIEQPAGAPSCQFRQYGIAVDCPPDKNLVVRAYQLLASHFSLPPVSVFLDKHIPTGAGLGGGSADASFMLRLLNEKFQLHLSSLQLQQYAVQLGADCPFFIPNVPAYVTGIGEVMQPLALSLSGWWLVVVKPNVFVSTRVAFAHITPKPSAFPLSSLPSLPVTQWRNRVVNDFEESIFPQFPVIAAYKEALYQAGAVYASMSGSGASLYGLFAQQPAANLATLFPDHSFFFQSLL